MCPGTPDSPSGDAYDSKICCENVSLQGALKKLAVCVNNFWQNCFI